MTLKMIIEKNQKNISLKEPKANLEKLKLFLEESKDFVFCEEFNFFNFLQKQLEKNKLSIRLSKNKLFFYKA